MTYSRESKCMLAHSEGLSSYSTMSLLHRYTWKSDAMGVLRGVPEEGRQKLVMHVEAYCALQGISQVTSEIIYGSVAVGSVEIQPIPFFKEFPVTRSVV